MAIVITPELRTFNGRETTIPVHIQQDDGTPLSQQAATTAVRNWAIATFLFPPRPTSEARQLSAHSYRFYLVYSTHAINQNSATPTIEVLEFPRLYLPEAKELVYPLERLRGSTGASGSDPEARFLVPSNAALAPADYVSRRVPLPIQNTTFTVDIPTKEKYDAFLAGIKKCHGKLNDDEFQGHPAGCVMILTAAPISPPGEIPRIDIGAAVGAPYDLTLDAQTLTDVLPFSWLGLKLSGVDYGIVGPAEASSAVSGNTVTGINELRVFDEADYSEMDLPEPA